MGPYYKSSWYMVPWSHVSFSLFWQPLSVVDRFSLMVRFVRFLLLFITCVRVLTHQSFLLIHCCCFLLRSAPGNECLILVPAFHALVGITFSPLRPLPWPWYPLTTGHHFPLTICVKEKMAARQETHEVEPLSLHQRMMIRTMPMVM